MSAHIYHTWICTLCQHWSADHRAENEDGRCVCKCGSECLEAFLSPVCSVGGDCVRVVAPDGWPGYVGENA